jgi:hypothetical protein
MGALEEMHEVEDLDHLEPHEKVAQISRYLMLRNGKLVDDLAGGAGTCQILSVQLPGGHSGAAESHGVSGYHEGKGTGRWSYTSDIS